MRFSVGTVARPLTKYVKSDIVILMETKPLHFMGASRKDLRTMPKGARMKVGDALFEAQNGEKADAAKPLKGFSGAGVLEVVADHDGDTYRAVYTVRFRAAVYVLHCFQKKSKRGIATPKKEFELIERRLAEARDYHAKHYVR